MNRSVLSDAANLFGRCRYALDLLLQTMAGAMASALKPIPFLASRCTAKNLRRMFAGVAYAVLCVWLFGLVLPLFAQNAPSVQHPKTPYLVNQVSLDEDTRLDSLEIKWVRGPISVRAYDGTTVTVNEYADRRIQEHERSRVLFSSRMLTVDWNSDLLVFDSGVGGGLCKSLEVLIPQELANKMEYVRVLSGASDISVQGLTLSVSARAEITAGSLKMKTLEAPLCVAAAESGDMEIRDCRFDKLRAKSQSGLVCLRDNMLGTADVRSVSGEVDMSGVMNNGLLQTYSGEVRSQFKLPPVDVALVSSTGDVLVYMPISSNCTLYTDAETLKVGAGFTVREDPEGGSMVVCGKGRGRITANTWEGNVELSSPIR